MAVRDDRARTGHPRTRPRDDRGQGQVWSPSTAGCSRWRAAATPSRRPAATAGSSRIPARGGRRSSARSGPCVPPTSPRSWRSASTDTDRRSWPSTRAARRPGRRSRSSTHGRPRRRLSSDARPASRAGRSAGCPRRSGSSATNRPSQRRPAGTSRPGSGWHSVLQASPTLRSSRTRSWPTRPLSRRRASRPTGSRRVRRWGASSAA